MTAGPLLQGCIAMGRVCLGAEAIVLSLPGTALVDGGPAGIDVSLAAARGLPQGAPDAISHALGFVIVTVPVRTLGVLAIAWPSAQAHAVADRRPGLDALVGQVALSIETEDRRRALAHEAEALRALEQRMSATRAAMEEGFIELDAEGTIVASNPAAERILGLKADQMHGRLSMDPRWRTVRLDGSDYPGDQHPSMLALRTGSAVRGAVMGVDSGTGDRRWILINAQPLTGRGEPGARHAITTFTDITSVLAGEQALRAERDRIRLLADELQRERLMLSEALEVGRMGAWSFDVDTGLFTFTEDFYRIYHTTSAAEGGLQMTAQRYAERFIPPGFRAVVGTEIERALRTADLQHRRVDHPVLFADGTGGHIQVSFRVQRDEAGRAVRLIGVNHDITERVQQLNELLTDRQRLAAILEGTGAGTWAWEIPTGRTLFNERWAQIVGYTLAELEPVTIATWQGLVHPEDGARSAELLAQHFAGVTESYDFECRMRHRNGSWVWVHDRGRVIERDASGAARWMYGTHVDITDRKLAELDRDVAYASLEQQTALAKELAARAATANRAKSTFLANMSHEIRTPMNGVLGMTELLLGMGLSAAQEDAAHTIYRSAEALLTILNDILDFSKVEAGRVEFESTIFDVEQVVSDVADLFRGRLVGNAVELQVCIEPGAGLRRRGDPGRLRQVLSNLVGNAVKFTTAGHVRVEVRRAGEGLAFAISDTGVGIPLDRQAALFEPFTQVDASTSRKYGGTGLGLAISRRLVEAMGGTVTLESELGKGTTFTLEIPLRLEAGDAGEYEGRRTPLPSTQVQGPRLHVLLAEDNPINQRVTVAMLERMGCQTEVVANGRLAVEVVATKRFDLLLMDGQMPELDGFEATSAIRAAEEGTGRRIPIVALTANASPDDRRRCLGAGMDDHLAKPARMQDLERMLTRWARAR